MRSIPNTCPFCGKEIGAGEEVIFISRAKTTSIIDGFRKDKRAVTEMTNESPRRIVHIGCWNSLFIWMYIKNFSNKPEESLTGVSKCQ
jgi:hypothetical protein